MVASTNSFGLSVIHAKRTEQLVVALAEALSPVSPFSRQTVLVPNSGMQRYLQLALTERMELLAHIDITYLGAHLWKQQLSGKTNTTEHLLALPDSRAVTFAIDAMLTNHLEGVEVFTPRLAKHLKYVKTVQHRFAWAKALASLMLSYATHRQTWLKQWQANNTISEHPDEAWQKALFEKLRPLFPSLIRAEYDFTPASSEPLHVFGFHAIPEVNRLALWQFAEYQPVTFYCLNPSSEYWGQLSTQTQAIQASLKHPEDELHHDIGNPLLANWGKSGQHLLSSLLEDADWQDCNVQVDGSVNCDTNLGKLQASIDALTASVEKGQVDDDSISLHACANARREVDVLFDWICQQLDDDSTLTLSDFLVMTPNIGDYASHIHAVFGQSSLRHYSVANQTEASAHPEVRAFLSVLCVIASRFSLAAFFDFCAQPAIMSAFHIDTQDLATIRHWFISANVNWGVTPAQKAEYTQDYNIIHQGSLEKLLDELNLAHVVGDTPHPSINPHYRATQFDTLKKLNQLHAVFADFANVGALTQSLSAWQETWLSLVEKCQLNESETLIAGLKAWYDAIKTDGINDFATNDYGFEIMYTDIANLFDGRELHGPFLSGGITFCAMQPMRAIPARVICMLGMNQAFPKPEVFVDYDLRKSHPAAYDVLRHDEQKYLMLETILSAREKLYFSYQGIDEKDAKPLPPSPLVTEIVHFFKQSGITLPHHTHALQRFHPEENWRQFSQHRDGLVLESLSESTEGDTPASEETHTFSVDELTTYLVTPLQAYLDTNRIRMSKPNQDLSEFEMLLPDGLDKYHIDKSLITDEATAARWLYQQNRMPVNALKSEIFTQQQAKLSDFQIAHEDILKTLSEPTDMTPQYAYLKAISTHLQYDLSPLYDDTRYLWDVSKLKLNTLVHAYLTQLCANVDNRSMQSVLLYKSDKKSPYHLVLKPFVDDYFAEKTLTDIVTLIKQCQYVPTRIRFSLQRNKQPKLASHELSSLELSLVPKDFAEKREKIDENNADTETVVKNEIEQCLRNILSAFSCV